MIQMFLLFGVYTLYSIDILMFRDICYLPVRRSFHGLKPEKCPLT